MEKHMFSFVCKYGSPDPPVEGRALKFCFQKWRENFFKGFQFSWQGRIWLGRNHFECHMLRSPQAFLDAFLFRSFTNFLERKRLHKLGKITTSTLLDDKHHMSRVHISSSFLLNAQPGVHHIQEVHSLQVTENPTVTLNRKGIFSCN